ncbi:hypothetical protein DFJ74DRAFT_690574 [Hyaloraphidium curvatum]|nr:hypothetical protein DFJ74DRAFT_690574 [Hyaloraphidium curvatum]
MDANRVSSESHRIPVLSLSHLTSPDPAVRERFIRDYRDALLDLGFFYLKDHGVPPAVVSATFDAARRFFALPESVKRTVEMVNAPNYVGWAPLANETTNHATDFRELFDIGSDPRGPLPGEPIWSAMLGPNQWPPEEACPGFRSALVEYRGHLRRVGLTLLKAMAVTLGLEENYFLPYFVHERIADRMKLLQYPTIDQLRRPGVDEDPTVDQPRRPGVDGDADQLGQRGVDADLSQGVGAHRDNGFLTMISQDDVGGLEVQLHDGQWLAVPPIPGTIVCNLGEMAQRVTNGLCIAGTHRVRNNDSGRTRYSVPFFLSPHLEARMSPIPRELLLPELAARIPKSVVTDIDEHSAKIYGAYAVNFMKGRFRSHPDVTARWWSHIRPEDLDALDRGEGVKATAAPSALL